MIRLIKRRLIIPRGDTGSFTIPTLTTVEQGDVAVFSVFDPLTKTTILEKIIPATNETLTIYFNYEDTVSLKAGKYLWDIKIYLGPHYDEDDKLCGGDEVHSYYAGYKLPVFEVREVTQDVKPYQNA